MKNKQMFIGINEEAIRYLSEQKNEPKWMLELRLKAFKAFKQLNMPKWAPKIEINFDEIIAYLDPGKKRSKRWEDIPKEIREVYEKLKIPEAERKFLAGVSTQFESEVVYENVKSELEEKGVIFKSMDDGLAEHEEIVKKYFAKLVPYYDNKYAALNTALWSGGSFVYIPKGVKVNMPLQAYFWINSQKMGQFERTLIIVDEGGEGDYIEGCSAPIYREESLHAAVVEVYALKNAKARYTTIQNWSDNVYNLVTKRSIAYENATVEWIDGNFGSKVTMKYPAIILAGKNSNGKMLSLAYASKPHQIIDSGSKIIHKAENTTSHVISKSVSAHGGKVYYRGLVRVLEGAQDSFSYIDCSSLIMDEKSVSSTYPLIDIREKKAKVSHEAITSKIDERKIFYAMTRGIEEDKANALIITGFIEEFARELPLEYAAELNRLIALEMEGSVG